MPPEVKYTRGDVLSAALGIVRTKGMDAITAREVAKAMGCSTRPIFSYFDKMEQLKEAVMEEIYNIRMTYVERGFSSKYPFRGYGLECIRFASEEPMLFKELYLSGYSGEDVYGFQAQDEGRAAESIMNVFQVNQEQAHELFKRLQVFGFGIQVMCSMGIMKFDEPVLEKMLSDECYGNLSIVIGGNRIAELLK